MKVGEEVVYREKKIIVWNFSMYFCRFNAGMYKIPPLETLKESDIDITVLK